MEGRRISHYDVLERLGGGGMGVVYKALDTRLNRYVALKFLPHELTRDDEARTRFVQEAQAASALDHPNICTIHEIDATADRQMFIAMALYDGATLKKLVDRGPLPIEQAVDIAMQMARGLSKAHAAGIVHRDVKPANVMVTADGFVKILDFGIAKLLGVTGPTRAGSTLGTVSYMAPEQVAGEDATPRCDVWALGVVLYEMLGGQLPFKGENQWSVMNAIANVEPARPRSLRPDVPEDVEDVVMSALAKAPEQRTPSTEALHRALAATRSGTGARSAPAPSGGAWTAMLRPAIAVPVLGLGLAVGAWFLLSYDSGASEQWARQEALPDLLALVDQDEYTRAFVLAEQIEAVIPNDPLLAEAWPTLSVTASIVTDPPDASVLVRPYASPETDWRPLGRSPIESVRLARSSAIELLVEKEGYDPVHLASGVPGFYFGRSPAEVIRLREAGAVPPEMVFVPGGRFPVRITGFNSVEPLALDSFLVDRHEVTNREYKEFVDAGGYDTSAHWQGLEFIDGARRLSAQEVLERFVDATGRPGPATWEFGDYPADEADHPVRGVSWYEAVAYTRFRDKTLPTIHHWARAAFEPHTNQQPLSSAMIPIANFDGVGPVAVGSTGAMGPYGTFDTAGNVKEWAWNASGEHRWLLGGAWDDDARMNSVRFTSPPMDRSPRNGFRGVRYLGDPPEHLTDPIELQPRDYRLAEAVSDEVFEIYRRQMAYVPSDLAARVEEVDESPADWTWERVSLSTGDDDGRFNLYLYLPKGQEPPYQVVISFPGVGPFQTQSASTSRQIFTPTAPLFDYMLRSGRAVVRPTWSGSYERWDDFLSRTGDQYLRAMETRMREWAADLGRTIDYIETRSDLDADRVAYWGLSFGASTSLPLLALEPRLRAALLYLPGYTYRELPPAADAVNYTPRTRLPVLMIGGRYDYVFPVETAVQPLFDHLGTDPEHKRFLLYEMGHGPFPRGQLLRDVLPWLDAYLGPLQ